MRKETRTICYDNELEVEAYCLDGIVQAFPNHFHEFYVIGYMMSGQRYLSCKGTEYLLKKADMVLFQPEDNHGCAQCGDEPLHYLGLNISMKVMKKLVGEITGEDSAPYFSQTVVRNETAGSLYVPLHQAIMTGSKEFQKEELIHFLISTLLQQYSASFQEAASDQLGRVDEVCAFLEDNYREAVSLEQICKCANMSKSALLRTFTREKGMTPYRYLQAVRINEAKKLLEQGISLIAAAQQTGFYDQSHFSRFFTQFTGLCPSVYRKIFLQEEEK